MRVEVLLPRHRPLSSYVIDVIICIFMDDIYTWKLCLIYTYSIYMYLPSIPQKRPHVLHRKDAFPQIPRELCPSRLGLSTLRRSTAACVAVAKLISSMVDGENDPGQYLGQLESAMMTFLLMAGCPNVQHCEFQGESPQWIDMN